MRERFCRHCGFSYLRSPPVPPTLHPALGGPPHPLRNLRVVPRTMDPLGPRPVMTMCSSPAGGWRPGGLSVILCGFGAGKGSLLAWSLTRTMSGYHWHSLHTVGAQQRLVGLVPTAACLQMGFGAPASSIRLSGAAPGSGEELGNPLVMSATGRGQGRCDTHVSNLPFLLGLLTLHAANQKSLPLHEVLSSVSQPWGQGRPLRGVWLPLSPSALEGAWGRSWP